MYASEHEKGQTIGFKKMGFDYRVPGSQSCLLGKRNFSTFK